MIKKLLAAMLALFAAVAFAAVDVNKATPAELDGVKGIGPAIAGKIVEERSKGSFKDWQDFIDRVKGVGEKNAATFSAAGLTVNGSAFTGAPAKAAAPAAKTEVKAAPMKEAAPVAAAPATMSADDKKAAAKKEKDEKKAAAAKEKEDKKAVKAKASEDAKAAKAEKAAAKKASKAEKEGKAGAPAAAPAAASASAAKK